MLRRTIATLAVSVGSVVAVASAVVLTPVLAVPSPANELPSEASRASESRTGAVENLTYVPIEPCRLADTRVAQGRIAPNEVRSYVVAGGSSGRSGTTRLAGRFEVQGGASGGCGVDGDAVAASLVVTAVDPDRAGWMRAWAYDQPTPPVPNATILNYSSALNAGNSVLTPICDKLGGDTCTYDLLIKNFGSETDLVIDITGYYLQVPEATKPMFAVVSGTTGNIFRGSGAVGSERVFGLDGSFEVQFDRDITKCAFLATIGSPAGGVPHPQHFTIVTALRTGTTDSVFVEIKNDGVLADEDFHVMVTC